MKRLEPKQTLSITIPITLYQRLQQEVGKGKISKFIEKTVGEKLEQEKENLGQAYQECYTNNPHLLKEAKLWERAEIEDWIVYEKNKNVVKKSRAKK